MFLAIVLETCEVVGADGVRVEDDGEGSRCCQYLTKIQRRLPGGVSSWIASARFLFVVDNSRRL